MRSVCVFVKSINYVFKETSYYLHLYKRQFNVIQLKVKSIRGLLICQSKQNVLRIVIKPDIFLLIWISIK